jgi:hypothetical protein
MKLVSDLDGVWTDQDKEAAYVIQFIIKKLSEITKFSGEELKELIEGCRKEMDKTPYEYGWFYDGKISAYYHEDPFGDNNAIFNYIQRIGNRNSFSVFRQKLSEIKKAILEKGFESIEKFSNYCFIEATKIFKESGKLAPHRNGKTALDKVLKKGIQVVVVSNSSTKKIEHLFLKMGKQPTNERSFKPGPVHARGEAMKYVINQDFKTVPAVQKTENRYDVQLRRQAYYNVLLDEAPDYVLGDVFSLDISLPLYLRLHDKRFNKLKLIQVVHKHTPDWVRDFLSKDKLKGFVFMIDDISQLPDVIKW